MGLVARAAFEGVTSAGVDFPSHNVRDYASAIGVDAALDGCDPYAFVRRNQGATYSGLVRLASPEQTDTATSQINGCIRALFRNDCNQPFVRELTGVVGDLHDNVWSHGKHTGFSMAQRWRDPQQSGEYFLEFGLADCGYGFRRELNRVGLYAYTTSDRDAIEWCLTEGNSSKNQRHQDAWTQRLPEDMMLNPIPKIGSPISTENHHQGLGLAKLVQLVEQYSGALWIASGSDMLLISRDGRRIWHKVAFPWGGVAIACRFNTSRITRARPRLREPEPEPALEALIEELMRGA